jgi:hypothetical protein
MHQVVIAQKVFMGTAIPCLPIKAANSSFIDVCDRVPHTLSKIEDKK